MLPVFIVCILIVTSAPSERITFSVGPYYSSHLLFQNDEDAKGLWNVGGEIGVAHIVPHVGLKLRGTMLRYDAPPEMGPYAYEYTPFTLCTSFDILPFLHMPWLYVSLETGAGIYWWKGLYDDVVIELPTGDTMEERDFGFVGGFTMQIKPLRFIALEGMMRYHYLFSSNIDKYGFQDKDDKIWENGVGLKFIIP